MRTYVTWLRKAMDRLDERYSVLASEPMLVEEVCSFAGTLADEAGQRAAKVGLSSLCEEGLHVAPDPVAVKLFLAKCVEAASAKSTSQPESEWLSVNEAAPIIGIATATLKEWCNHIDPRTSRYSPKIEHVRVGGRGRPNQKNGLRGDIKFHRDVVARFVAARTKTPLAPPVKAVKATASKQRTFKSPLFDS